MSGEESEIDKQTREHNEKVFADQKEELKAFVDTLQKDYPSEISKDETDPKTKEIIPAKLSL